MKKILGKMFTILLIILIFSNFFIKVYGAEEWRVYTGNATIPLDAVNIGSLMMNLINDKEKFKDNAEYKQVVKKCIEAAKKCNSSTGINNFANLNELEEIDKEINKNTSSAATQTQETTSTKTNNDKIIYGSEGAGMYALSWRQILDYKHLYTYEADERARAVESYIMTDLNSIKKEDWDKYLGGLEIALDTSSELKLNSMYIPLFEKVEKTVKQINSNSSKYGLTTEQKDKVKELVESSEKAVSDAEGNKELKDKEQGTSGGSSGGDSEEKEWTISGTVISGTDKGVGGESLSDPREDPSAYKPSGTLEDADRLKEIGALLISVLRAVGIVVAVMTLSVLGFKYMTGSVSDKAEYKKSMIPFLIGAGVLLIGTQIVGILFELVTKNM